MWTSVVLMLLNIVQSRRMPMEGDYFNQWDVRSLMPQHLKENVCQAVFLSIHLIRDP